MNKTARKAEVKNLKIRATVIASPKSWLFVFPGAVALSIFFLSNAFAMQASWYARADLIRDGQDKENK